MKKLLACFLAFSSIYMYAQSNMVLIKGGTFLMGSPSSERQRNTDEKQHSVTISDFYCDPYEVTQKDYQKVMNSNPSTHKGENLPVQNVTYFDAINYCNAKSKLEGLTECYKINKKSVSYNVNANGYRLLTEAEWEYACRAGTTTIFNTGNWNNVNDANYQGSYPYLIEENYMHRTEKNVVTGTVRNRPLEVNSFKPNNFGIYNMHGNVSEWVFDFYGKYNTKDTKDPIGALKGSLRVNRGGSYNDFGKHLRSAYRSATNPLDSDENLGFRIARNAVFNKNPSVINTVYDEQIASIKIPNNPKILIAYFSYSGNTKDGANYIYEILKNKYGQNNVYITEIQMVNPYRGGIYEASQKDLNANARPAITTRVSNMKDYDVVLLGYPTWWATIPMPVMTFLDSYDFSNKTVISFSSHGGTHFGDSVSDLSKALPKSYVGIPFGFYYRGGSNLQSRIKTWLTNSGL